MTNHERFESAPLQVPLSIENFPEVTRDFSSRSGLNLHTRIRTDLAQAATTDLPGLRIVDTNATATDIVPNRLPAPEIPRLNTEQINNLIRGQHGLGSESFREREEAQRQLIRSGADALPAVLNALHDRSNLQLEVRRRLESFSNSMVNNRFNDLLAATRNNDPAIAQAAEVMLSRETTDSLLSRSIGTRLSQADQRTFNELIERRLNEGQLQAYLQEPMFGWTEAHLRRAVAVEGVLGQPSGSENQVRLGVAILSRTDRTPAEQSYAESLLTAYTQNGRDPVLNASAHRLLASSAFQRGDANEGMRLMRNSMQLITGATNQTKRADVLQELQDISAFATSRSEGLNAAQRQELAAISRRASEAAILFARERQQWLDQSKR